MATSLARRRPLMNVAISIATLVTISAILPYSVAVAEEGPPLTWYKIWTNEGHDAAYGVSSSGDNLYVAASSGEYSIGVDTFLLKYNSDGDLIWSKNWAKNQINEAHSVAVSDSGIYVAGLTGSAENLDAFLLKYDFDGNLIWSRIWGEGQLHWAQNIAVSGNSVYIAGSIGDEGRYAAFISKFDSDGNSLWNKTYSGSKETWTQAYGVTVSGNSIYLAGSTGVEEDFDSFLLKYDSDGNLKWSKVWTKDQLNEARGVAVSGSSIYVTGWIASPDNGVEDSFLLKYDSDGNLKWSRVYGEIETEIARGVTVSGNSIYVAGQKGVFQRFGTLLLKYDSDGNLKWGKNYESSRFGGAYSIVISGDSIYTAGVTWGIGAGFYEATLYKFPLDPINTQTASSQVIGTEGTSSTITYIVVAVPIIALIVVAVLAMRKRA